jgi:hypothetical protein
MGSDPDALLAAGLQASRPTSGPNPRKVGAHRRKNISFTVAATILGLSMMLWAKSAVVATQVDVVRPPVGTSPNVVISNSYLPIQVLDETY